MKKIQDASRFFFLLLQINSQTKLIEVLRIFQSIRISALPVVDNEKRLCDVYSKFDIMVTRLFDLFFLITTFSFV